MMSLEARAEPPILAYTLALAFACAASGAAISLFLGAQQIIVAILGAVVFSVAFALSGNQRLFCLWGLVLTVPLEVSKAFWISAHMGGASAITIDLCDFFIAALLVFILRDVVQGRRTVLRFSPLLVLWGALAVLGVIDVLEGPRRQLPLLEVVRMAKCYLLFFVIINEVVRVRQFLHCFAAIVTGVAMQAVVTLLQYITEASLGLQILGEPAPEAVETATRAVYFGLGDIYRAGGLFSHPNLLAGYMALLLPVCIAMLLTRVSPPLKVWIAISIVLGVAALLITLSRTGWLAFAVGFTALVSFSIMHQRFRRRYVLTRMVVIGGLVACLAAASGYIIQRLTQSDPGALNFRFELMQVAWNMVEANPLFGVGLNGFVAEIPNYSNYGGPQGVTDTFGESWPVVHNSYLVYWSQQGTVGFVLLILIYFTVLRTALRTLKYFSDDVVYALNLGAFSGIVAIMVDGIGSFFINEPASLRVFWLIVGLIFALHYWTVNSVVQARRVPATHRFSNEPPTSDQAVARA